MKLIDLIKETGQPVPLRAPDYESGQEFGERYACWQTDRGEIEVIEDVDRWCVSINFDHPTARPDIWRDIVAMINARFANGETP